MALANIPDSSKCHPIRVLGHLLDRDRSRRREYTDKSSLFRILCISDISFFSVHLPTTQALPLFMWISSRLNLCAQHVQVHHTSASRLVDFPPEATTSVSNSLGILLETHARGLSILSLDVHLLYLSKIESNCACSDNPQASAGDLSRRFRKH